MDGGGASIVDEARENMDLVSQGLANPRGFTLLLRGDGADAANQWRRVRLSVGLNQKLLALVAESIRGFASRDLAEYTYDEMTPSVLGVWQATTIPDLATWFNGIPDHAWAHIFDGAPTFSEKIRYQVYLIDTEFGVIRAFHKKGANAIAHRGITALLNVAGSEFSEVTGKIFNFETKVDFFEFRGTIFIGNSMAFELSTNVRKITSERAEKIINMFHERSSSGIVFVSRESLINAIKLKPLFAKKIASARVMGTISALTAEKMIQRIEKKSLKILYKKDKDKIYFKVNESDSQSLRDFVELITDTYLISDVTDLEYKTHSKQRV